MLGSRHEIARLQGDFFRDQYRKILRWLAVSVAIIFLLLAGIIYHIFIYKPVVNYYANTTEGRILDMPLPGN